MKRVIQLDSTGCGLACVAMVTGTSYSKIKAQVSTIWDVNDSLRTDGLDLRELFKVFNIATGKKLAKFYKWENLPPLCILAINYSETTGNWHWVVFVRNQKDAYVLDPRKSIKTNRRKDFRRMKPKWYLTIHI